MKYIHTVCVYTHSSEFIESNCINLISKLLENNLLISK